MMKTLLLAASGAALASAQATEQVKCSPLHYVYARATTEVPTGIKQSTTGAEFAAAASKWWSLGYGAAGGALWLNLTDAKSPERIEGITGFPVPYPADTTGLGGAKAASNQAPGAPAAKSSPQIGVELMLAELRTKSKACPKQKYVLGGHSQGGGVTVAALRRIESDPSALPKEAVDRIVAVTMFGSPPCPDIVKGRCMSYCHAKDFACDPSAKGAAPNFPGLNKDGSLAKPAGGAALPLNITPTKRGLFKRDYPKECPKDVKEAGYVAKAGGQTGTGPHLSYNADGYYVKAAACYINEKYKAASK